MIFAYVALMPYRMMSGGFHLHTHLGCIMGSIIVYYGNIYLSKFLILDNIQKYILIGLSLLFGILMVSFYAPADTENVPILSEKERKKKRKMSYITLTISLIVAAIVPNSTISNIIIIGMFIQSITITKIAYQLTKNKYGYEAYGMQ